MSLLNTKNIILFKLTLNSNGWNSVENLYKVGNYTSIIPQDHS